jgi:hypothetical protein
MLQYLNRLQQAAFGLIGSMTPIMAAPVVWENMRDLRTPADLNTQGVLIEAFNASPNGGAVTAGGVTFSSTNGLLPNGAIPSALSGQTTLDPGFDELLTTLDFGGGTSTTLQVGNGNLVIGQSYRLQLFFTDLRPCCSGRVMTYGDGQGSQVNLNASGSPGSFGQTVTGTFVASGTSQTLTLSTNGFGNAHLTGYQIRTAASPPTINSFTATPALIAAGETSTLVWEVSNADSVEINPGGPVALSGSLPVNPSATQTYTLTATNGAGAITSQVVVGVDLAAFPPVLNEFAASNDAILADEDGDHSDWIEIANPNTFDLEVGGYYLTDDPADPTRWQFPPTAVVEGSGFLIVFASGKDRAGPEWHTNFRLSADEGYLALIAPDGFTIVGQFPVNHPTEPSYPGQRRDISYGLGSDSNVGFFGNPTPGATNGTALNGFVADTAFSVDRDFFEAPTNVEITSPTPGSTIVFTTNGTVPTLTNGTISPPVNPEVPGLATVTISSTTILRAAAFKEGMTPTNVDTQTYLFASDILDQPAMDPDVVDDPAYAAEMIPALKSIRTLSIVTDPENLYNGSTGILANTGGRGIAWERPVSIEFIDPENPAESYQTNAGLRVHGNGSRGNPKNSLRLLFRADYADKKLQYPLFGEDWVTTKFNTVVLRAQNANSWTSTREEDRRVTTFTQDAFAKDMQGVMGHPTAGATFVHLYLNGVYWGLYNPVERPDGSFGEDHFGGDDTDYDALNRRFSVEVLSGSKATWDDMITLAASGLATQSDYEQLADFIDLDNLIDYMLLHQFMQTRDGPDDFGHNNMRLVRRNNPAGPFRLYAWDMEYSMIDTQGTRAYDYPFPIYSSGRSAPRDITDSIASVYIRLKDNNPEFQLRYADRAYRHLFNGGAMTPEKASAQWLTRADEIGSAIICESARWGDQRRAQPYTRDVEWMTERSRLLNEFFPARPDHVVSQLRLNGLYPSIDPPQFSQHGGSVPVGFEFNLTSETGTIYYTLDGSDPREAWTNGIASSATELPGGTVTETLVSPGGANWRYLDQGIAQSGSDVVAGQPGFGPEDWKHPDFDESEWKTGTTPLGYGGVGNPPVTFPNVGFGPSPSNRYPTTYFRREFDVVHADLFSELSIKLRRDDGAILYLNGREIVRSNLRAGLVEYSTLAASSVGGLNEEEFFSFSHTLQAGELVEGTNVLAVEIHQATSGSNDLVFDLELEGTRANEGAEAISLSETTTVKARALVGQEWSALAEASFVVGTQASQENLVISELHYNPLGPSEGGEFIELMNISDEPIELIGSRFTEGIEFVFTESTVLAPAERVLIVNDPAAFSGNPSLRIVGSFSNGTQLSNGGERIALVDASDETIFDFEFGDRSPWPASPDGGGPSLTLILPLSNPSPADPASWRPSSQARGTPGGDDATRFAGDPNGDDNGNGVGNLIEYALGASLEQGSVMIGADRFPTLTVIRNLSADDVEVLVETSPDLITWESGSEATTLLSVYNGDGTMTMTWQSVRAFEEHGFFRIRVLLK